LLQTDVVVARWKRQVPESVLQTIDVLSCELKHEQGKIDHTNKGRRDDDLLSDLLDKCKHYQEQILPLRCGLPGSNADENFTLYDETYNEFLESMHARISQHFENIGKL
jgi:hypothetical protein